MENESLLILANLLLSMVGGYICICRMAKMSGGRTKWTVRLEYSLTFALFVYSGLSFASADGVTVPLFIMTAGLLGKLTIGTAVWRYHAPWYTDKGMMR